MRNCFVTSFVCAAVILGQLFGVANHADAADDLEKKFQTAAQDVLQVLRQQGISNTGVLKFSVRIGDGDFPPNVGSLNTRLAEKLELALVLANPAHKSQIDQQVGVIRNATDIAASIDGASHATSEGRQRLFTKEYPLAWKHKAKTDVIPDSLIVGVAQVHADLSNMDIELMLLKKSDLQLSPLAKLTVPTDLEDLIDSGESFTTRGIFDDGSVQNSKTESKVKEVAKETALLARTETLGKSKPQASSKHPLALSSDAPIKFEIFYDNKIQDYEFRDGAAFVAEPYEGQDVIFAVRRKNATDKRRLGILVRVNGENTLYRQKLTDQQASLWIFEPTLKEFSIRGFQMDEGERQKFRVLSAADSEKRKINYGRDIGMISVTVFAEESAPKPQLSDTELDLAVQSQAKLPDETKESRGELGSSLFDQLIAQATRGAIVEGAREAAKIDTVEFKRNPTPVMSATVRYYKPTE